MKQLHKKCALIDWRDKVEEIATKLKKEERLTIDSISSLLEEGVEKGFVLKQQKVFLTNTSNEEGDPTTVLMKNFHSLQQIITVCNEAIVYEREVKKVLASLCPSKQESITSSNEEQSASQQSSESVVNNIQTLNMLEQRGKQIKVEVDNLKVFVEKLS